VTESSRTVDPSRDAGACAVGAFGVVRAPLDEIPALRKAPGPLIGHRFPPSLLKHADGQTVLATAAILRAIHDARWHDRPFHDWGVIAAPRFLGRLALAPSLRKFSRLGASSVSPMIIPTLSLHAVAGSISMVLKAHGFNFGVGGAEGHLAEALLVGLAAWDDRRLPGVWVVATEWDPEPIPDDTNGSWVPSVGTAVALALVPSTAEVVRAKLRLKPVVSCEHTNNCPEPSPSPLQKLAAFLTDPATAGPSPSWSCPLQGGGAIVLDDHPARREVDQAAPVHRAGA
jgi:hypothetical protein